MPGSLYLSAGEPSGETHLALAATHLRRLRPDLRLSGMGGDPLRAAGVETVADADAAVTGFVEVIAHLGTIRRLFRTCLEHIRTTRPDVVVLTDYGGFHLRLAKALRRLRPAPRVLYYIPPKFWAWNHRRVRTLRRTVDEALCILPFEPDLLAAEGVPARFVGNPLLDELDLDEDGAALRRELGLEAGTPLVGLFPGSRRGEVQRILPALLDATDRMRAARPKLAAAVAAAPHLSDADLAALAGRPLGEIPVVRGRAHEVMAAADLLLAKSGTTTLEAALYGTPMLGLYRTAPLTHAIARRLLRTEHFTLPNLLLHDFAPPGRTPTAPGPEFLQDAANGPALATAGLALLDDAGRRAAIRAELLSLRTLLGERGVGERTARALLDHLPASSPTADGAPPVDTAS
ncbi:MAG: lipid-A-disaccharide synthase [Planctomycetota bacterium]